MRRLISALVYIALAAAANADPALEALREGTMKKLIFSDAGQVVDEAFTLESGGEGRLSDYAGKHVVLNFWATWCAPCRKEMPMLDALQKDYGGEDFEVVTIATGRNSPQGMRKFFDEIGIEELPLHTDPRSDLARAMGVLGLPVTVLIDPDGNEIARMRGDAEWDSDSARAIIEAWTGDGES